jgi:hypothetical protein
MFFRERLRHRDLGAYLAFVARDERAERLDDEADGEQPPVLRMGGLAARPPILACSSTTFSALACSSAPKIGLVTSRFRSVLPSTIASKRIRSRAIASSDLSSSASSNSAVA